MHLVCTLLLRGAAPVLTRTIPTPAHACRPWPTSAARCSVRCRAFFCGYAAVPTTTSASLVQIIARLRKRPTQLLVDSPCLFASHLTPMRTSDKYLRPDCMQTRAASLNLVWGDFSTSRPTCYKRRLLPSRPVKAGVDLACK